jgi:hypothetical protein
VEDPVFDQAHVARSWLQKHQLVDERAFEHGFADIDAADSGSKRNDRCGPSTSCPSAAGRMLELVES